MKKFICVLCLLLGATVSHAGVADYIISMARQGIFPMEQVFIWIESLLNSTGEDIVDPQGNGVSRVVGDTDMFRITYSEEGKYTMYILRDGTIAGPYNN